MYESLTIEVKNQQSKNSSLVRQIGSRHVGSQVDYLDKDSRLKENSAAVLSSSLPKSIGSSKKIGTTEAFEKVLVFSPGLPFQLTYSTIPMQYSLSKAEVIPVTFGSVAVFV
ncbi:uncharacterized protein [Montipora capricornis]|uniref:uncharacterized protein n=1 Tax=Montipora capricornis TaxID=246305 RepID=UPI0035F1034B